MYTTTYQLRLSAFLVQYRTKYINLCIIIYDLNTDRVSNTVTLTDSVKIFSVINVRIINDVSMIKQYVHLIL